MGACLRSSVSRPSKGSQSPLPARGVVRLGHQSSGGPAPPPRRRWVVSHFSLEQLHSRVQPAAGARWGGGPAPGKEASEGINAPNAGRCPTHSKRETTRRCSRKNVMYRGRPGPSPNPARVVTNYMNVSSTESPLCSKRCKGTLVQLLIF